MEHRCGQLGQVEPDVWDVDGDVFGHLQDLVEPEDKQGVKHDLDAALWSGGATHPL